MRVGKILGKIRQRKYACIVVLDMAPQIAPNGPEWTTGINMAAPDPLSPAVRTEPQEGGRLGVVDKDKVRFFKLRAHLFSVISVGLFVSIQKILGNGA